LQKSSYNDYTLQHLIGTEILEDIYRRIFENFFFFGSFENGKKTFIRKLFKNIFFNYKINKNSRGPKSQRVQSVESSNVGKGKIRSSRATICIARAAMSFLGHQRSTF
jgi:hypothetical protein